MKCTFESKSSWKCKEIKCDWHTFFPQQVDNSFLVCIFITQIDSCFWLLVGVGFDTIKDCLLLAHLLQIWISKVGKWHRWFPLTVVWVYIVNTTAVAARMRCNWSRERGDRSRMCSTRERAKVTKERREWSYVHRNLMMRHGRRWFSWDSTGWAEMSCSGKPAGAWIDILLDAIVSRPMTSCCSSSTSIKYTAILHNNICIWITKCSLQMLQLWTEVCRRHLPDGFSCTQCNM